MAGAARTAEDEALEAVTAGTADDPFAVLGPHQIHGRPGLIIRTMQPAASAVEVVFDDRTVPMIRRHPSGLFEATIDSDRRVARDVPYRLRIHEGGVTRDITDPY